MQKFGGDKSPVTARFKNPVSHAFIAISLKFRSFVCRNRSHFGYRFINEDAENVTCYNTSD